MLSEEHLLSLPNHHAQLWGSLSVMIQSWQLFRKYIVVVNLVVVIAALLDVGLSENDTSFALTVFGIIFHVVAFYFHQRRSTLKWATPYRLLAVELVLHCSFGLGFAIYLLIQQHHGSSVDLGHSLVFNLFAFGTSLIAALVWNVESLFESLLD